MAQFDPNRPPMSLSESEELLNGRNPDAETFGFWFGLAKGLLKISVWVAAIAVATYLCVAVPAVGWAVAGGVLVYAIVEISKAGKK